MAFETPDERAEIWTKPVKVTNSSSDLLKVLGGHFGDQTLVFYGDGSVHWIEPKTLGKSLWARFTRTGGETLK